MMMLLMLLVSRIILHKIKVKDNLLKILLHLAITFKIIKIEVKETPLTLGNSKLMQTWVGILALILSNNKSLLLVKAMLDVILLTHMLLNNSINILIKDHRVLMEILRLTLKLVDLDNLVVKCCRVLELLVHLCKEL